MVAIRHLNNAPIREALVDFRVRSSVEPSVLEDCAKSFQAEYPKRLALHKGEFGFTFNEGGITPLPANRALLGYRLDSRDGRQVVQFRVDGFTFSRLPKYETFDRMREEAQRLWAAYAACLRPQVITRVAVRFINVMELPVGGFQWTEFLTAPPNLPAALPQAFNSFLERVVFQDPATGASVILTQAFEGAAGDGRYPVTLDIDAFRDREFDPTDANIWTFLEELRGLKNRVFFESITERTAELYE
jgi:uncharacterized protein (TIGR04255 family)